MEAVLLHLPNWGGQTASQHTHTHTTHTAALWTNDTHNSTIQGSPTQVTHMGVVEGVGGGVGGGKAHSLSGNGGHTDSLLP